MEPHTYIVEKIEGDYAYLKQTDAENPELFQGAEPAPAFPSGRPTEDAQ